MKKTPRKKGRKAHLRTLWEMYRSEHPDEGEVVDLDDFVDWVMKHGHMPLPKADPRQLLKKSIASTLRQDFDKDEQGREVHRMCSVVETTRDGEQRTLLGDRISAKPAHMHKSLQQRRQSWVYGGFRIKTDRDSYCDNNQYGAILPLFISDATEDIAELEQRTEYGEGKEKSEPPAEGESD